MKLMVDAGQFDDPTGRTPTETHIATHEITSLQFVQRVGRTGGIIDQAIIHIGQNTRFYVSHPESYAKLRELIA